MPPERHSGPPPRPPRDRHAGPSFGGGPRRTFGGPGGPGGPREGAGPRPPFSPRPPFTPPSPAVPAHSVRLRDGDREVEVSGTPDFIRQTLDDLPSLLARLRGEAAAHARPASISMPPPPRQAEPEAHAAPEPEPEPERVPEPPRKAQREGRARHGKNGSGTLEDRVFDVLARAGHPLSVAGIREQLGGGESGQQIRRILERASDRVASTDERPAAYSLR